jgi:hypothetical protein
VIGAPVFLPAVCSTFWDDLHMQGRSRRDRELWDAGEVAGVFAENGGTWQAAGPALPAGFGGDQVQVLGLAGGRVETIAGAGEPWRALPHAPAGTVTLAPGASGGYDALAASGSVLTVWRLASAAWAKVQVIRVPIEYGSSS